MQSLAFIKWLVASFALLYWCAACTSARHIEMKTETGDTVRFIWTLNEDSLMNNPFLLSNSKRLEFTLRPPRNRVIKLSFGAGGWAPAEVQKLVGYLTLLEIISPKNHLRIDSLPQLRDFLLARRRGIGGGRIVLTAER